MIMISYKLGLSNGDSLEIAFAEEQPCTLTINGNSRYTFGHHEKMLKITWEIPEPAQGGVMLQPDIISVTPVSYVAEAFRNENNGEVKNFGFEKHNCCTLNGKEYCIFKGCVKAPCGTICAPDADDE